MPLPLARCAFSRSSGGTSTVILRAVSMTPQDTIPDTSIEYGLAAHTPVAGASTVTRALISPYRKIDLIEYDRRGLATPPPAGHRAGVDKRSVKTTLAMLEARTGRVVRFKDEEARRSLHG